MSNNNLKKNKLILELIYYPIIFVYKIKIDLFLINRY